MLSAGAACFVLASVTGRHLGPVLDLRTTVWASTALLAVAVAVLFGAVLLPAGGWRAMVGALAFGVAAVGAGLRIPATTVLGMAQRPERPDVMMASRVATVQAGYLLGSALSGATIATRGWLALGVVLGLVLAASAALTARLSQTRSRPPRGRRRGPARPGRRR